MSREYEEFLASKDWGTCVSGLPYDPALSPGLFPFQADCVRWALRKGRAAIFSGTGLGKTYQQLEWARHVSEHTGERVLILAPLAVARQTVREGETRGITVTYVRSPDQLADGINITNYQMLDRFDPGEFSGVVLDESSILKSFDGKTRTQIISAFAETPYRLACTATPAPNDHQELGNHAEFLGVMTRAEMLATFFTHDGGDTSKWRLKGHAEAEFWRWVCSWAVMITRPSDLGYDDGAYVLPPLNVQEHKEESPDYLSIGAGALTLGAQRKARRASLDARCRKAAILSNDSDEQWLIWCDLNDESAALHKYCRDSEQVTGSDEESEKEAAMMRFTSGQTRVLITKPSICGWGMNWQHCRNMIFVGLTHSYEALFQAIRRCWRFGQTQDVNVHIITSVAEDAVLRNIKRKEQEYEEMCRHMIGYMRDIQREQIKSTRREQDVYAPALTMQIPAWLRSE